jgi:sec-independent protein translocase protein TatA
VKKDDMASVAVPLLGNLGPTEIILILLVIVLLFGAKKLPELARGSGRALRIFKAETKGLLDDDEDTVKESEKTEAQRQLDAQRRAEAAQRLETPTPVEQPRPDVER